MAYGGITPYAAIQAQSFHTPGYTETEKIEIGKRFLIPKQMKNHGLKPKHIEITDEAMTELVRSYTHEAGVRNLEREIANVMRKVARQVAEGRKRKTVIDPNTGKDFVSTRALKGLRIEGGDVAFQIELGYPGKSQHAALRKAGLPARG